MLSGMIIAARVMPAATSRGALAQVVPRKPRNGLGHGTLLDWSTFLLFSHLTAFPGSVTVNRVLKPHAAFLALASSSSVAFTFSHANSLRPKCPYAAVLR
jgi:hypothetical protein